MSRYQSLSAAGSAERRNNPPIPRTLPSSCPAPLIPSPLPFTPLFGRAQHLVSELVRMERLRRLGIAGIEIGVDVLRPRAPGLLHGFEIGVGPKSEQLERAQFVTAARAVARARPAIVRRLRIARRVAGLRLLPRGGFLVRKAREVIPARVVFGGVRLAEIPAFAAVGRLGRGAFPGLGATRTIAQPHLG